MPNPRVASGNYNTKLLSPVTKPMPNPSLLGPRSSKEKKKKYVPAKRPRAFRKGSLTSKLARGSPKGPQT
eukprot:1155857-Pelagomonas_calceolata.AAC.8